MIVGLGSGHTDDMLQALLARDPRHCVSHSTARVAIVLGAGRLGLRAAEILARQGARVSVFERGLVPVHTTTQQLRALLATPTVRVVGRVDVIDVLTTPDGGAVRGVRLRLGGVHEAEFPADVVVDTMPGARGFAVPRGCAGYVRRLSGALTAGVSAARDEDLELALAR